MQREQAIKGIIAYCRDQIVDFKDKADLALSKHGRLRCSFEYADSELASQIVDCIDEWCTDNECESLCDDISVEEILLNM